MADCKGQADETTSEFSRDPREFHLIGLPGCGEPLRHLGQTGAQGPDLTSELRFAAARGNSTAPLHGYPSQPMPSPSPSRRW
jgi:hypothetical protein